jgi:hypothetical protein
MFGNTNKSFGKIRRIRLTRFAYPTKFVALEKTAAWPAPASTNNRKVLGGYTSAAIRLLGVNLRSTKDNRGEAISVGGNCNGKEAKTKKEVIDLKFRFFLKNKL